MECIADRPLWRPCIPPLTQPHHELVQALKEEAARLRFDACGIATAASADPEDRLGAWIGKGYHAKMQWMERTRSVRQDPRVRMPGARSVVVLARNYYHARPVAPAASGRVARYAWGRDYHRVIRKPLKALAEWIERQAPETETWCSIDSGPVLERSWAARAGIGWVGKNSLILRRDLGSWFFLATIVTTLPLAPDAPVQDACGSCTACLDACPTGAIVAPEVVDAGRCISYHTIENREEIPTEIQAGMEDWIFGCDICQEVCPWNRFAKPSSEDDFMPRAGQANPLLRELALLDDATFEDAFRGTPLMRAKRRGLQRNAAIASANRGDCADVLE